MTALRTILLAEDSPADAEMAIDALKEARLANPIVHVEDGVEAMDYLLRRGAFANRDEGLPGPNECCGSGCPLCVLDLYSDELQRYRAALAAWNQRHPEATD